METQKLSVKGLAIASAILGGGGLFLVGVLNLWEPVYGQTFLQLMSSCYPLYDGVASWRSIMILTGLGTLDCAVCGIVFALIYNLCIRAYKKQS